MTKNFFQQIKNGLRKAHQGFIGRIANIFSRFTKFDEDFLDELETALIEADIGPRMSMRIIEDLQTEARKQGAKEPQALLKLLQSEIESLFEENPPWAVNSDGPTVFLIIGVNGVGKTTTIAKMARYFQGEGKSVLLAAGDTFRAAATEQLKIWAGRLKIDCIAHSEGADAAAVCYDAISAGVARKIDVILVDTAGRLHNKTHLIEELKKIKRTIQKIVPSAPHETLLVLDATTGQNGLYQAQAFGDELGASGIVLTKLDGTAKGGIALTVSKELGLPIRLIGFGEQIDDLAQFNAAEFTTALFAD